MPDSPRDRLAARIRQRRAILVVGAGIPIGAVDPERHPTASWPKLVESGLDRCEEKLGLGPDRARPWRLLLEQGELITVAEEVTRRLRAAGGAAYSNWLETTVGAFEPAPDRDAALRALAELADLGGAGRLPLVTTNYDDLLEEATGRHAVTWQDDPDTILDALAGRTATVLHLHGHWRKPDTIVLGERSYSDLTRQAAFQHLQRAAATFHSLIFVGCGATLEDPNLGALIDWLAETLPGQRDPHFRIAPAPEIPDLEERHAAHRVQPVPCGSDHAALAGFLRELVPAPETAGAAAEPVEPDLTPYLRWVERETRHIHVGGIVRRAKKALQPSIERLYTPLSSRAPGLARGATGRAGPEDGEIAHEGAAHLSDLLPRFDRLLLVGQPGAGKTTFLRFVACMLARDLLHFQPPGGGSWRGTHLRLDPAEPPPVPVFLRISALAELMLSDAAPRNLGDNRRWLLELLAATDRENGWGIAREQWEALLAEGRAILLLDGLDEAADEELRDRILRIFQDACEGWPCPVVVTSRPLRTAPLAEMGFATATVEPFGDTEIRTFIDHWVRELHAGEELPAAEGGEPAAAVPPTPPPDEAAYREALTEAILGRPRVKLMATNPVMLTCLAVVHWNEGRLPEGRSLVYTAVIRWLLRAREPQRKAAGFDHRFALEAFSRLALAMMTGDAGKRALFDLSEAVAVIEPMIANLAEYRHLDAAARRRQARRWLRFEALGSGILEELPGSRLRFWHLTFQEYLAALELAWRADGEKDPDEDWWPVVREHLEDPQWRETVELLPGCLLDEGGSRRVNALLDRARRLVGGETRDLRAQARIAGLLGRLLRPLEVMEYHPAPEIAQAYEEALEATLSLFTVPGSRQVPFDDRLAAADALGLAGDPRLDPGVDNFLPIPDGGGVRLGRYPVTVEEYQRFVEAGGYGDREVWSEEGWAARDDRGWEAPGSWERQLEHPNRPVVEVSWWEAETYCAWLARQRAIPARLPSEEEWRRAASREKGAYPWGEAEPDGSLANFAREVGHPTPVGLYPAGAGPGVHEDLAGNVWEWCADDHGGDHKGLRGGGWGHPAGGLRSAIRDRDHARYRSDDFGFRVSVSPPSP